MIYNKPVHICDLLIRTGAGPPVIWCGSVGFSLRITNDLPPLGISSFYSGCGSLFANAADAKVLQFGAQLVVYKRNKQGKQILYSGTPEVSISK